MAKMTRKTEPKTAGIKPATRRTKAAAPAGTGEKVTTRRRTTTAPEAAPAQGAVMPEPTHDEIALRAWSIYQGRGASHGDANRDWLEARAQLLQERGLKP